MKKAGPKKTLYYGRHEIETLKIVGQRQISAKTESGIISQR